MRNKLTIHDGRSLHKANETSFTIVLRLLECCNIENKTN